MNSESKPQIQAASDLNSEQTKSVNLPECSYKTHMLWKDSRRDQERAERGAGEVGHFSWVRPDQYMFKSPSTHRQGCFLTLYIMEEEA